MGLAHAAPRQRTFRAGADVKARVRLVGEAELHEGRVHDLGQVPRGDRGGVPRGVAVCRARDGDASVNGCGKWVCKTNTYVRVGGTARTMRRTS